MRLIPDIHKVCWSGDMGLVPVPTAERLMCHAAELRADGAIEDLVLFMAHPRTVALGLRDRNESHPRDLLVSPLRLQEEGIALVRSIRGGGITYHWPGQVVCYPIVKLEPGERDVPAYMGKLEEVCIQTLGAFGVRVERRRDTPAHIGLWWNGRKVVSMGIRISRWVTSFGFVINYGGDHRESAYVRPCGIEGARLATLEEILGTAPPRQEVAAVLTDTFSKVFSRSMEPVPDSWMERLLSASGAGEAQSIGSG